MGRIRKIPSHFFIFCNSCKKKAPAKTDALMSYCRFELQTHALKGRCSTY